MGAPSDDVDAGGPARRGKLATCWTRGQASLALPLTQCNPTVSLRGRIETAKTLCTSAKSPYKLRCGWSESLERNKCARLAMRVCPRAPKKPGPPDRRPARRAVPRSLPREGVRQSDQGPAATGKGHRRARHG